MPLTTPEDTIVGLCDWRGHCVWISGTSVPLKVGDLIWQHLTPQSQIDAKAMLGRAVTLRESGSIEVVNKLGGRYRTWYWPLDSPAVAICCLSRQIPNCLEELTKRERDCLELLAQGIETRIIAKRLDVSLSTIHTHMKRAREKLGLRSVEALISFAARYCYPLSQPLNSNTA